MEKSNAISSARIPVRARIMYRPRGHGAGACDAQHRAVDVYRASPALGGEDGMFQPSRLIHGLVLGVLITVAGCSQPSQPPVSQPRSAGQRSLSPGGPEPSIIETFHDAITSGDTNRVRAMLRSDRRLARADYATFSPLQLAAYKGRMDIVKLLLHSGVRADAGRTGVSTDWTPLHWAVLGHHPDIVRLLIENGADVNASGAGQKTPLHQAVELGDVASARLLLQSGADVNATDDRGFTPLHIALQRNDSKLTALLQSYGGRDTAGR